MGSSIKFVGWVASPPLQRGTNTFIILRDVHKISENGEIVPFRKHLWVSLNKEKRLRKVELHQIISFQGLVYSYIKSDNSQNLGIEKIRYVEKLGKISGNGRDFLKELAKIKINKKD